MIPAIVKTSAASIDEIKFHNNFFNVTKFSKEWKIWLKTHFLGFALFVGNFSNKHHYNLLKILRIFCLRYFCPKWLFPELFVLKFDLCIKVVALIKITTVYDFLWFSCFCMVVNPEDYSDCTFREIIAAANFQITDYSKNRKIQKFGADSTLENCFWTFFSIFCRWWDFWEKPEIWPKWPKSWWL